MPRDPQLQQRAVDLLHEMLGSHAGFRDGQLEAILAIADDRARVLLVQRTGWGKSLVYFIATKLLRERGFGPALLVSPLLSLMRNQVEAAERIGIRAARVDSTGDDDLVDIEARLAADDVDVLLVSPERLANARFLTQTLPTIARGIGVLVIDEAHCISDWGHDFRPDYRRIVRIAQNLPATVPVLATTATANNRVTADIRAQLGDALRIVRGPLTRESLRLQAISLADQAERLAWLAEQVPALPGSGIIYCLTVADCERVADWLQTCGVAAEAYHSRLAADRETLEQRLLRNEVKALVATVALGMGFDKPDLGFVVHFQRPGSLISYYQQIGRAGRAVPEAFAVLLGGREDDDIQDYFIRNAFPQLESITSVLREIEAGDGVSEGELQKAVNLSLSKLRQCLKLLDIDGAIVKDESRYFRTANAWTPDVQRWTNVTQTRREELAAISAFVSSRTCLMRTVAQALDDAGAEPCGHCSVCLGALLPIDVTPARIQEAVAFLRRSFRSFEPRAQWAAGAVDGRRGAIPVNRRASVGRVLSMWGDAGWGALVKEGKYRGDRFADELVVACVEMIRAHWRPEPFPTWVTAIPSLRHPLLVPDFARRLAEALGLPFVQALQKVQETPAQKLMENSSRQLANIAGTLEIIDGTLMGGAVLLVDDMVDSRWTLTEAAFALRSAGSGAVHPLALAMTSSGGDGA